MLINGTIKNYHYFKQKQYLHLLLRKPIVIENIVHLNRTSRETSRWETGALKRAVSRVSVKETGVRPSTLACNLVLFVCHNKVIIHITHVTKARTLPLSYNATAQKFGNVYKTQKCNSNFRSFQLN